MAFLKDLFQIRIPGPNGMHGDARISEPVVNSQYMGYPGGSNTYVPTATTKPVSTGKRRRNRASNRGYAIGFTRSVYADFNPSDHPRGQPGNAGQFAPSPGASSGGSASKQKRPRGRVKGAAQAVAHATNVAATAARRVMYDVAMRAPQILNIWTTIFEGPEDLQKIGYNPSFGNTEHATYDPLKDATGVSAHLALNVGTKILGKAISWAKRRITGQPTQASRYSGSLDFMQAAEAYLALTNGILASFGMYNAVDVRQVAANMAHMFQQKSMRQSARAGAF